MYNSLIAGYNISLECFGGIKKKNIQKDIFNTVEKIKYNGKLISTFTPSKIESWTTFRVTQQTVG